ncbi:MAG TPA: MFS transporter [Xanthobacteraceae bacterium]|jgi:MFS family permease
MASSGFYAGRFAQSRAAFRRHRQNKRTLERTASRRTRRGLDWLNFFLADVQTGFGAFVAFYLAGLHWSQESVGVVLTIGRVVSALGLIPGGALADATPWKRALTASGLVMIAGAALILALWPTWMLVAGAEVLHGLTAGILGPAIAAMSLGIVGRRALSSRTGRNHRFQGAGNALTAVLLGLLGYVAQPAIFLATAALTIPALVALCFIRSDEIDFARARNAAKGAEAPSLGNILELRKNSQLLWFACCVALFQFADASLLPLASEQIGSGRSAQSSLMMSGLVVTPQVAVAILAPWIGYLSELWGRKPLLLIGFAVQIVRAGLFAFISSPILLIAVQFLDGVTGAILTVLTVVIVADLTAGTGRFNLARGAIGFLATLAASFSTAVSGFISQEIGRSAGFLGMGAVAAVGTLLVWLMLAESKPERYEE